MADQMTLGIVGGGTMGSGIALAALLVDIPVVLYEIVPEVLARAQAYIETQLNRKKKSLSLKYLEMTPSLEAFARCQVVIEAIPEQLSLKQELFAGLDAICPPPAILATNTSTLSVTAIASACEAPERVAGMHFFNPAAVLPLVEVIRGARTSAETMRRLVALAEKLGKTPVIAKDTPGFIVNRIARPFYGEALRLLGEGVASHEAIDRIVREGGGFRMGPFELMDLIGIDVNFTATQSIFEQSFQEPRYRPHPIQAQMVAQRAFGRKSGGGFYPYPGPTESRNSAEAPGWRGSEIGLIYRAEGSWSPGLEWLKIHLPETPMQAQQGQPPVVVIPAGRAEGLEEAVRRLDGELDPGIPLLCQCADTTLAEIASWVTQPQRMVGFDGLFFGQGGIATLVQTPFTAPEAKAACETCAAQLGKAPVWIEDSPGLVLPRIISCLTNEAAFAVQENVATAETIDRAMQLGTNYPRGPLAWARDLGYSKIIAILDHLQAEFREERYRAAPLLRRWARLERFQN